ncbi:alpha/beta hydrolase [Alteriqipengyuania lutimaris]|uniref:Alpha/beta hydrolase n=1 Tax=Alteriqipengyuania lutimaris TaxID=1538146 RepID=A0A395LMB2_9SPHN|nr:alpha/beta hydrolase [Alteriqipengyuania lutimaris]MBB3032717.1 acetyl esterase [Alteriqipengyuania lutimaris]RDS78176.1 alpha/beta hydrolase [Alteriqipengyuania lutimaris]
MADAPAPDTQAEPFVRDDVRGLLDMLKAMGRPPVEEAGAVAGREGMRMLAQLADPQPHDLAVIRDVTCPGPAGDIPCRFYDSRESRDAGPAVLFLHGGGFVIGDLEVYHALCTEFAQRLDLPVLSVDYRLAPEHPFPAAPDDCEAAARWLASSPAELGRKITGLVVTGDSAGGNLTIVVTNALRDQPADVPVLVQAPIYPVADEAGKHESFRQFKDGYFLTGDTMAFFTKSYAADPASARNLPMLGDCSNAPATVLCTAGLDPLRDSGRAYAKCMVGNGTQLTYLEFPGIIHGFFTMRKAIPSGQADVEAFIDAVGAALERQL